MKILFFLILSQEYSDGYHDGWQYAFDEADEAAERDIRENWQTIILGE